MPQIAAADAQAMNTLFSEQVTAGAKQAGIYNKDLPQNTPEAFADWKGYIDTVEAVLSGDDKQSFDPNDPKLD